MFASRLRYISRTLLMSKLGRKNFLLPKSIALVSLWLALAPSPLKNADTVSSEISSTIQNTPQVKQVSQGQNNESEHEDKKDTTENSEKNNQNIGKDTEQSMINFIHEYDDAKKLNLSGHTLIWYQCTGEQYIDNQVIEMLNRFVKSKEVSCAYKIIIDRTPRSSGKKQDNGYYKKPVELVVIKPDDLKPISISKYLSFNGVTDLKYTQLFEKINKELNKFEEIGKINLETFKADMGTRSQQAFILMNAPRNKVKPSKAKKRFSTFVDSKQAFTSHSSKAIVTDEEVASALGLPEYQQNSDNIYIVVPRSQNVTKSGKPVTIENKKYYLYKPEQVYSSLIFPPYLQKSGGDTLTLKVTVDLNQNSAAYLAEIYEILGQSDKYPQLSSVPKLITFNPITEKGAKPYKIDLQKNDFEQILQVYSQNCRLSTEQKKQILKGENTWRYGQEQISPQSLDQWIKSVIEHKVQPTFESEIPEVTKVKAYNSEKITGETYLQIFKNQPEKPKLIFHYSEHCHSCNKFKHIYEQIAEEKKDICNFYRINNDHNKTKGLRNYNSTPVFVMYRNGHPFYFKNTIFTKTIFQDFIQVTNRVEIVENSVLDKLVQQRNKNKFNIADLA